MASLTLHTPGGPRQFNLRKKLTSIGAVPDNDVVVADFGLGDHHASVFFDGERYTISALDSRCTIQVNGKARKRHMLDDGDEIELAKAKLVFDASGLEVTTADSRAPESVSLENLQQLVDFSRALAQPADINALLTTLMDMVIALSRAERGFLLLWDNDHEEASVVAARNIEKGDIDYEGTEQISDSILEAVLEKREALIVSDAVNDTKFGGSKSVVDLKLSSVLCLPIELRGNLLGVIYLGNDSVSNLFQYRDLELLTVFAAQASLILSNAMLINELEVDRDRLAQEIEDIRFGEIVGSCAGMQKVFNIIEKVAGADVSVLVTGETGTGKELVAQEIHRRSDRLKGPFMAINCGAIPENLIESELFGHRKGSFTGADRDKVGKFQAANGGTIFLDEIGELPLNLQVKLLRFLQEKTVTRVGDTKVEEVDARILAATNRNLEDMVAEGRFREDLYYRLNVVTLEMPPLRDRDEDIVLIAQYFLDKYSREFKRKTKGFNKETLAALRKYAWPGNIRELENKIRKAIVMSDGLRISPEDVDLSGDNAPRILTLAEAKERFQQRYIEDVLALNSGNRTKTAADLGVDPRTIYRYLAKKSGKDGDDDGEDTGNDD